MVDTVALSNAVVVAFALGGVAAIVAALRWAVRAVTATMVKQLAAVVADDLNTRPLTNGQGLKVIRRLEDHMVINDDRMNRLEERLARTTTRIEDHVAWEEGEKYHELESLISRVQSFLAQERDAGTVTVQGEVALTAQTADDPRQERGPS